MAANTSPIFELVPTDACVTVVPADTTAFQSGTGPSVVPDSICRSAARAALRASFT